MLALNYLSWAFIASVWAFFMALFHRYDAVIVHETSPVTQGFPALVVKSIRRIPMYFWDELELPRLVLSKKQYNTTLCFAP